MRHVLTGFAAAVSFVAFASPSEAATTPAGGALLELTNGQYVLDPTPGGFQFILETDFFAQSLISDLDTPQSFLLSASIDIDGLVFEDSLLLPPFAPQDAIDLGLFLFNEFIDLDDTPFPPFDVTGGIETGNDGIIIRFGLDELVLGPDSVSGELDFIALIATAAVDDLDLLGLDFSGLDEEGAFSAVFTLTPAVVPVPAALPLALTGAALLAGLGLRRRRTPAPA